VKLRIGRVVAGVMAVVAAALMATAGNAAAEEPPGGIDWDRTIYGWGVVVYVETYGDIVSVCDTKANGSRASVAVAHIYGAVIYRMDARDGAGTCETRRASDGGKYNLKEDEAFKIYFKGTDGAADTATFIS
jgi:hypothetical protein